MRRRFRLTNLLTAAIASSIALITMVGLFVPEGFPEVIAALFLQLAVITAAIAVLIGILNLLSVHLGRIRRRESSAVYSIIAIATAVLVILVHALNIKTTGEGERAISGVLFEAIQVSLESALAGLLFFFLVYAAYRMMHRGVTWNGCLFTGALLLVLVGWLPLQGLDAVSNLRDWLLEVPVTAGTQGLLIGIALGTVTVGLRVLIGQERAFREE